MDTPTGTHGDDQFRNRCQSQMENTRPATQSSFSTGISMLFLDLSNLIARVSKYTGECPSAEGQTLSGSAYTVSGLCSCVKSPLHSLYARNSKDSKILCSVREKRSGQCRWFLLHFRSWFKSTHEAAWRLSFSKVLLSSFILPRLQFFNLHKWRANFLLTFPHHRWGPLPTLSWWLFLLGMYESHRCREWLRCTTHRGGISLGSTCIKLPSSLNQSSHWLQYSQLCLCRGHVRPLCAFVARAVQLHPVYVTFLIAGDNVSRVLSEIQQYFDSPEQRILLQRYIRYLLLSFNR